jgi:hypothetical protein
MLAVIVVAAIACDVWTSYDNVFKRTPPSGAIGWTGGDGAISIALPGSGTRSLWLFGDSFLTGYDPSTDTRTSTATVFGTNIGLLTNSTSPDPANIGFSMRNASTRSVMDVTSTTDTTTARSAFFDPTLVGVTVAAGDLIWPNGGTCLNCDDGTTTNDRTLVSFVQVRGCTVGATGCIPLCTNCTSGVLLVSNVIDTFTNPGSAPSSWGRDGELNITNPGVLWGQSFMVTGGQMYIYGLRRTFVSSTNIKMDAVVARTTPANVLNQATWSYWMGGAFQAHSTEPAASTLDIIAADVSPLFSVHEITRRGLTRYLLIHDHPGVDHFLFARTSLDPTSFQTIRPTTPRLDLSSIDSTLGWDVLAEIVNGCPPQTINGVPDYRACGLNYHSTGHQHLSTTDSFGISGFVFSYVVPHGFNDNGTNAEYYRPRFGIIPLDNMDPWCHSAGADCWAGIVDDWPARAVSPGNDVTYTFGLGGGTGLTALFTGGTGNPDLYLKRNGIPTTTSFDCRSASSGVSERCSLSGLSGTSSIGVRVVGTAGSTYALRVQYDGF